VFFNPDNDLGSTQVYGQTVQLAQPEFWSKSGYCFNAHHAIVGFVSAFHQQPAKPI
jgi:hypothetical protein